LEAVTLGLPVEEGEAVAPWGCEALGGGLGAAHGEQAVEPARGAAGECDDPIGGTGEVAQQHMGRVARLRIEPGAAAQIHQIHVAALALGQQHDGATAEFALLVRAPAKARAIAKIHRDIFGFGLIGKPATFGLTYFIHFSE
jgi:hypothetical protein